MPSIPSKVAHALWELLKEELNQLQKQHLIVPLGVDKSSEWYNSFVLVPKANDKM